MVTRRNGWSSKRRWNRTLHRKTWLFFWVSQVKFQRTQRSGRQMNSRMPQTKGSWPSKDKIGEQLELYWVALTLRPSMVKQPSIWSRSLWIQAQAMREGTSRKLGQQWPSDMKTPIQFRRPTWKGCTSKPWWNPTKPQASSSLRWRNFGAS